MKPGCHVPLPSVGPGGHRSASADRPPGLEDVVMRYVKPGDPESLVQVAPRYENFIGGKWLEPTSGKYSTNLSPALRISAPGSR